MVQTRLDHKWVGYWTILQGLCWVLYLEWTQSLALCLSQKDAIYSPT